MKKTKGYIQQLRHWFVFATLIISIQLWSFSLIPEKVFVMLQFANSLALLAITAYYFRKRTDTMLFRSHVLLFMLVQVVSAFASLHYHDQPLKLSLLLIRGNLFWLFYFVLHFFNVPPRKIITMMIFIGGGWALITIAQQFTYPTYYFYTRTDANGREIYRSGVYRFMVMGFGMGLIMTLYCCHRYLITRKLKWAPFVLLGLLGFYYFGTRQAALALAGCMLTLTLLVKGRARIMAFSFVVLGVLALMVFGGALFSQYIELTQEQWKYGDDVRQLSANFYLFEYWPDWTAVIFGNGPAHKDAMYGQEIEMIRAYFHFYRSDVGVIGGLNEFGLFYALNAILVNVKGLRSKYYGYNDQYVRMLYLFSFITLLTSEGYGDAATIPYYSVLFYLTDKAYSAKLEAQQQVVPEKVHEHVPQLA